MMTDEKISIVVPIYNVEEYLPRCLDSIIVQTYTNIEIMLVDDGSPDNAGAICDEYATKDSRIRVFHIPNGGVAKARQLGVENSMGEYIVFVDPDDWLPLDSIEVLYSNMSDDVDIVIGANNSVCNNNPTRQNRTIESFDGDSFITKLLIHKTLHYGAPWGRIYRKHFFASDDFPSARRSQDWLMNISICSKVRFIKSVDNVVYNYTINQGSASNGYMPDLEYNKQLSYIVKNILTHYGKYAIHESEYRLMQLRIIHDENMKGVRINLNDDWINEVLQYFKGKNIGFKYTLFIYAIKHKSIRNLLCNIIRIKRLP